MKEYIKVLEITKEQYESALDDGRNSTDKDAIEAVEDNALVVEALNMAIQALIDFPTMLNQYLAENDQMIIGKNVYEELKYELETLKKSAEPQEKAGEWLSTIVKEKGWNGKERQYYQPISCSECHKPNHVKSNYCPNCGAKMKGAENE